jgi:hypothetical protein
MCNQSSSAHFPRLVVRARVPSGIAHSEGDDICQKPASNLESNKSLVGIRGGSPYLKVVVKVPWALSFVLAVDLLRSVLGAGHSYFVDVHLGHGNLLERL